MDGAVIVKVVIMALILVLVIVTICTCNKFMVLKTRAENQASQIDIQLARRADLIPNLVEIVKGYAKHEKETLAYESADTGAFSSNLRRRNRAGNPGCVCGNYTDAGSAGGWRAGTGRYCISKCCSN